MTPQPNHTRFIIASITWLATVCAVCGAWLLWKGFAGGGELVMTVNTAIAGMVGFLANRQSPPQTASGAVATETTNTTANPVPILDTHPKKPKP